MHASKGLEWPLVFVARMNEGECPLSVTTDAALEEERRLAYVAPHRIAHHGHGHEHAQ